MMQNTAVRLTVVFALALVVHLGYLFVRSRGMPTDFRPLQSSLEEMPMSFGPWQGEDVEQDPRISSQIDADEWIDRVYRHPQGYQISLHANAVKRYLLTLQHHPRHCYTSQGIHIVEDKKDARLELPDGSSIPIGLMVAESEGQRMLVLYWYQLDVFRENDNVEILLDHNEQRELRWKLRGQETWPPVIKVLLQTTAMDTQAAETRIKAFAAEVYQWTKYIDRPRLTDDTAS